jgi:4-diphosphocytidyl-2-C-methyl-D-erythritol kinase
VKTLRILSPAKINLHLRVGPRAADGFHPLLTWMCTVGLHDTIDMTATPRRGIRLVCDRPDVPVDATNLIVRAADALKKEDAGAEVRLQKNIPPGGGLGGGSSNAAFALRGFNDLWDLNHSEDYLAKIAAHLGSDVPFFLRGPSSICAGRGERILPIDPPLPGFVVLVFPKFAMPTAAVYRKFDEMNLGSNEAINQQPNWASWTKLSADALMKNLLNDLEAPAFSLQPELGDLRRKIEQKIGRTVRMTGSGSTLFTLADDSQTATAALARIRGDSVDSEMFELGNRLSDQLSDRGLAGDAEDDE